MKASQDDGPLKVDESSRDGGEKLLDMVLEFRRELYLKREEYDLMVSQIKKNYVAMLHPFVEMLHSYF